MRKNGFVGAIVLAIIIFGVALVSGFSPNIAKMVMSGQTDPYECLLETLNSDRYKPIGDALENQ